MGLEPTSLSTGAESRRKKGKNRFPTTSGDLRKLRVKAPGTGIEPATFGDNAVLRCPEPDATTSSCYTGSGNVKDGAMLALTSQARGRGFEPLSPDSKSGSLPLADPRIRFIESAMRESNPPTQLGRLAPFRSANGTYFVTSGRGTNPVYRPIGAQVELAKQSQWSATFEAAATMEKAPVAGVEPALIRLTGGCLTVWPHRNVCGYGESVRSHFESTNSWFRTALHVPMNAGQTRPEKVAGDGFEPSTSRL